VDLLGAHVVAEVFKPVERGSGQFAVSDIGVHQAAPVRGVRSEHLLLSH